MKDLILCTTPKFWSQKGILVDKFRLRKKGKLRCLRISHLTEGKSVTISQLREDEEENLTWSSGRVEEYPTWLQGGYVD